MTVLKLWKGMAIGRNLRPEEFNENMGAIERAFNELAVDVADVLPITTDKIANGAVTGGKIALLTITDAQIALATITGAKIAGATIETANIKDANITSAKIGLLQVNTGHIDNLAVTNGKIANLAVDAAKIALTTITAAQIALATIDTAQVKDAAIDTAKIKDAAVTNAKIGLLAVDAARIALATIEAAQIKDATITGAKIAAATIDTANIKNSAIDTAQIKDGSITDAKIVELTANKITSGQLSTERLIIRDPVDPTKSLIYSINNITGALQVLTGNTLNGEILTSRTITADKVVAHAITAAEIAAAAITANEMLAGTITAASGIIADAAITNAKIANVDAGKVTTGILQSTDMKTYFNLGTAEIGLLPTIGSTACKILLNTTGGLSFYQDDGAGGWTLRGGLGIVAGELCLSAQILTDLPSSDYYARVGDVTVGGVAYKGILGFLKSYSTSNPVYYVSSKWTAGTSSLITKISLAGLNINSSLVGTDNSISFFPVGKTYPFISMYDDGIASTIQLKASSGVYLDITNNPGGGITRLSTPAQIKSTLATGTKPFDVTSTTLCTNLNVDLLDGYHHNDFLHTTIFTPYGIGGSLSYIALYITATPGNLYILNIRGNPNAAGSSLYMTNVSVLFSVDVGWSGTDVTAYLRQTTLINHVGVGALTVSVLLSDFATYAVSSRPISLGLHYFRVDIDGFNAGTTMEQRAVVCTVQQII